jgi:hypothetical protein
MTDKINNQKSLSDIISENNISLDFLKSSLGNEDYHNTEFNYNNLFWRFNSLDKFAFDNFFHLLQKTEDELSIGSFGDTIKKLKIFLKKYNCSIGMLKDFTNTSFLALTKQKIKLEDLTTEEKTLSLVAIKCLVNQYGNDMELGREIRKTFNQLKP